MSVFIALAMFLDALLMSTPKMPTYTPETYLRILSDDFVELGGSDRPITIFYDNITSIADTRVPLFQQNKWCGRIVSVSTRFRYPDDVLYDTPALFAVIAHERSHVLQGVNCDRKIAETEAELISWYVLGQHPNRYSHRRALLWSLRESAILSALEENCDHTWIKDMSSEAWELYSNATCGGREKYTNALELLLENDVIELPTVTLDMTQVKELLCSTCSQP